MSDYVFYPVTGDGLTSGTGYTWNTGIINYNTGGDWAAVPSFQTLTLGTSPLTGTVPNGSAVNAGLVAGAIDPTLFGLYTPNPGLGDPYLNSNEYPVDVLINSGSIALDNLMLTGFNQFANILGGNAATHFPTLDVEGAALTVGGAIIDSGVVTFPTIVPPIGPPIHSATGSGGGTIDLGQGASVSIAGAVPGDIQVHFNDGANNTLDIGVSTTTNDFAGTITGFVNGDTLLLPNVPVVASGITTTASFDVTTNVLAIIVNDPTTIDINIPGFASQSGPVSLTQSGTGTELVTCFVAGTRIMTASGYCAVEDLRVGEVVLTRDGKEKPIVWIGHRRIDCRRHPRPETVWPVRMRAHAFAPDLPERDLLLSPQHAVFDEGVLIPAKSLVNGTNVVIEDVASVVYYHIELPEHDLLIAEGLLAESYLENGDRGAFDNGGPALTLHPDFSVWTWDSRSCAELKVAGPEVGAVRAKLARRAKTSRSRERSRKSVRFG